MTNSEINHKISVLEKGISSGSLPESAITIAKRKIEELKSQLKEEVAGVTIATEAKIEEGKAELATVEAAIATAEGDTKKAEEKKQQASNATAKAKQIKKIKKPSKTKKQVMVAHEEVIKSVKKAKARLQEQKSDHKSGKGKGQRRSEFMQRLNSLLKRHKALKAEVIGRPESNLKRDAGRLAKPAGKRTSESGKTYYESRANRSDHYRRLKLASGGKAGGEGIDLFEDYENIPANVQKILDKHEDAFVDGDYDGLRKAKNELKKIGYTFSFYLDGQAYDLRKVGEKGKAEHLNGLNDGE